MAENTVNPEGVEIQSQALVDELEELRALVRRKEATLPERILEEDDEYYFAKCRLILAGDPL